MVWAKKKGEGKQVTKSEGEGGQTCWEAKPKNPEPKTALQERNLGGAKERAKKRLNDPRNHYQKAPKWL